MYISYNKNENKKNEEIDKLKGSLANSINTMSTSFNALSKDVTRDMTHALTKVDEKVNVFNQQVESISSFLRPRQIGSFGHIPHVQVF